MRQPPGYTAEAVERASVEEFLKMLLGIAKVLTRPEIADLWRGWSGPFLSIRICWKSIAKSILRPATGRLSARFGGSKGLLPKSTDTDWRIARGALIYRVLFTPERGDSAKEVRAYLIRILRIAGFDLSSIVSGSR